MAPVIPTSISPATFSMSVIATAKDGTNYVRLPRELWRSCGVCHCPSCLGKEGFWDTLAVPAYSTDPVHPNYSWTVHMPNPAEFRAYVAKETK